MNNLPAVANLLVGGGVMGVAVALITGWFARSTRKSDYAHKIVEASGAYADRADKRVIALEERQVRHERTIDRLKDRLWKWSDLMRQAVPLLRADGHVVLADRMAAALESGAPQDPPADPTPTP